MSIAMRTTGGFLVSLLLPVLTATGCNRSSDSSGPTAVRSADDLSFRESDETVGETATAAMALGDVDGDGSLDLVTSFSLGARLFLNDGSGTFTESGQFLGVSLREEPTALALGDADDDEDLDLFVGLFDQRVGGAIIAGVPDRLFLNNGEGTFIDSNQRIGNEFTTSLVLGDVDGDGFVDLITANSGGNRLRLNDGLGGFEISSESLGDSRTSALALGDLDGDGDLDLVAGNSGSSFAEGILGPEPDRIWTQRETSLQVNRRFFSDQTLGRSEARSLALGDLDGDGSLDIVAGNARSNRVWFNDGTGSFPTSEDNLGEALTNAVELADLDLDDDLDLVEATERGTRVWLNDGTGSFSLFESFGGPALSLVLGDLDDDGDVDIITGTETGARVFFNELR